MSAERSKALTHLRVLDVSRPGRPSEQIVGRRPRAISDFARTLAIVKMFAA